MATKLRVRRESSASKAFKDRQAKTNPTTAAKADAAKKPDAKAAKGKTATAKTASPKTAKVVADLATMGQNGPKAKDFALYFRTAVGLKTKVDEAQGLYRNNLKRAKEAGIDPGVITNAMQAAKKDPLVVQSFMNQLRQCYEVAGVHVQLDMFNEGSISRPAQIFDDGYKAGFAGKPTDENPHDENTKAGQRWLAGHHEGNSDLAANAFQGKDSLGEVEGARH